ncbi:hypothetical protein [Aurantimonas endophytica]|uniref:Uncharacterized protein n=1 Tax=Aurantimonas endophytica TaxID=1522175 RepID=A0A7W6HB01_9HYPH|nr:hypothetical protein [Aurantimonas endophytica]MBB4001603.1 hypothetical protein [Aurantimonas endophytica]MCO6402758.1 hypothetical protein [Aurantimonas endophytica]
MSLRVYAAPTFVQVSKPGFDATSGNPLHLVFSSNFYGHGGGIKGTVVTTPGPIGSNGFHDPTDSFILLPPGTGIPVYFIWQRNIDQTYAEYGRGIRGWFARIIPEGTHIQLNVTASYNAIFDYMIYRRDVA